jgi:hypothetical protein
MNLHEKLANIQKKLKAPKSQFNSFGKYNYRNCEDILEAVKPLLDGAILTITDNIVLVGDRYYVMANAALIDEDGTSIISTNAYAREEHDKKGMDAAQITGAASSYARKYALNGLFLIDDTKDADTRDNTKEEPKKKQEVTKPAHDVQHSDVIKDVPDSILDQGVELTNYTTKKATQGDLGAALRCPDLPKGKNVRPKSDCNTCQKTDDCPAWCA